MVEREKVIDILGACGTDDCDNCLLNGDERCSGFVDVPVKVLMDALALLKEQEPKVIELSEISPNIYVWVEDRQEHTVFPLRGGMFDPDGDDYFRFLENVELDYVYWPVGNYGYSWRVWDKCPTEEQRKAVAWDG